MINPKKNRLAGMLVYLAGPIDFCPNHGTEWRKEITPKLEKFGLKVIDPTNKPSLEVNEDEKLVATLKSLKEQEKFDEIYKLGKKIRNFDLRCVDLSSFTIVYLDFDIKMCGTWEELFMTNKNKHPCLVVSNTPKKEMPNWLLFTLPHQHIFQSFDELLAFLEKVDNGYDDGSKRWIFFSNLKGE